MAKPKKLILVTATHHPLHELWMKLSDEVSKILNIEREVRYEDYVLLTEHGDTDDLGMPWLPQLLIELDDGSIKLLLSKIPLNKALQPDYDKAKEEILNKIKELEKGG